MQINVTSEELAVFAKLTAAGLAAELRPWFHQLMQEITNMSATVDAAIANLTAKVEAETTVNQSAVTLISGFPQMIADAVAAAQALGATPAQLAAFDALGTSIQSNADSLAAAVSANTPAPLTP